MTHQAEVSGEDILRQRLRDAQFRVTPGRLRVFRALQSHAAPVTIQTLADELTEDGLNLTTVYRVMEAFVALSVAHPTLIGHQTVGYELVEPFRPHHDHLVCSVCGQVVDIYECGLNAALAAMSRGGGYQVEFHQVELHGVCAECSSDGNHGV
ncbi:MAG: Fur family transcriptional regulator [Thermaerobacter sp.]|nr:Fur family transcriptional regulator [Thermaerobacter sp.]